MSQSHSPLAEEPVTASAPPEPPQDRKRAFTFCASSFGVVRLEDVHEIANLKADLVACYRPVNSQEMFALERMAIAQQLILRAARLDAGLFTSAMNEVLNLDHNPIVTMDPDMIGDIEVTRQQNRNFCIAEGFRRIAKESDLMNLALRYRIQAERDYRRALEEFQRLERLRPKLPNEPNLLTDPDGKGDIVPAWELNPWIPKASPKDEPVRNDAPPAAIPVKPEPIPAATAPLADVSLRPQASFTGTRAASAAPQFTGLWDISSQAPAAHRSFVLPADLFSTRPRARTPRVNSSSASMRTGRFKNSEAATPVSSGTRFQSRLWYARASRTKLSCGDGSSSASAPPVRHPK